jgi:uncharacterized protein (TIGR02001 family)
MTMIQRSVMGVLALAVAGPALAQDGPSFPNVTGTLAVVSDYRFRGVSLSNKKAAVQGSLQLNTEPGFFAGVWASNIAEYGGADVEVDLYGGWTGALGPATATVGVYSYLYPGGSNVDVYELYGSLGYTIATVTATVGLNIAPDQKNLATSSRYAYLNLAAGIPDTPVTLKANIGHERGSFVVDGSGRTTEKFDYLVGADVKYEFLTLGLAYIGNDLPEKDRFNTTAKNRFVVSLTASF